MGKTNYNHNKMSFCYVDGGRKATINKKQKQNHKDNKNKKR